MEGNPYPIWMAFSILLLFFQALKQYGSDHLEKLMFLVVYSESRCRKINVIFFQTSFRLKKSKVHFLGGPLYSVYRIPAY